jgi:myo-inositol-1-phosphate synthase
MPPCRALRVEGPALEYAPGEIRARYVHRATEVVPAEEEPGGWIARPREEVYEFRTDRRAPTKLGVMLVGWGGSNGTTLTAGLLAHRHSVAWRDRKGERRPNFWGSFTQAATTHVGTGPGGGVHAPFAALLPMAAPADLVLGGWDVTGEDLGAAAEGAGVLEPDLLRQLRPFLAELVPLPGVFDPGFVAPNQAARARAVVAGGPREQVARLRGDLRAFRERTGASRLVVLWAASTERAAEPGLAETAEGLLAAIAAGAAGLPPSVLYAAACAQEGVPFINGSPQDSLTPGVVALAALGGGLVAGDDLKSGQTKVKSALVEMLVGAGLPPQALVSYNHLGNNDGANLSAPQCVEAKLASKTRLVEDILATNGVLFPEGAPRPDHRVVIEYIPHVGDSKRAIDEYSSGVFLGGTSTLVLYHVCEDSLLAAPLFLDLALLADLFSRIRVRPPGAEAPLPLPTNVSGLLAYFFKKPSSRVGALGAQRAELENFLRICAGLPPVTHVRPAHFA